GTHPNATARSGGRPSTTDGRSSCMLRPPMAVERRSRRSANEPCPRRCGPSGIVGKRLPVVAPARPVLAAGDGHEMRADIDVDVVHVGIRHGTAIVIVGDQPADDELLAAARIEIDGVATGVLGRSAGAGNGSTGTARGDKFDGTECLLDTFKQCAGG